MFYWFVYFVGFWIERRFPNIWVIVHYLQNEFDSSSNFYYEVCCTDWDLCWFTLQDYEYGGYNPIAYDIANHFCEMTANYHSDTPHIMHFNTYPGK